MRLLTGRSQCVVEGVARDQLVPVRGQDGHGEVRGGHPTSVGAGGL